MIVAVLAVGIIALAAWAGLHLLKTEYLPLLEELERSKKTMEEADTLPDWKEEGP